MEAGVSATDIVKGEMMGVVLRVEGGSRDREAVSVFDPSRLPNVEWWRWSTILFIDHY